MPLDIQAKIDLFESDPSFMSIRGTPEPSDDTLHIRLASDYLKYKEMLRDGRIRSRLSRRKQSILGRAIVSKNIEPLLKIAGLEPQPDDQDEGQNFDPLDSLLGTLRFESLCSSLFYSGSLCGFSVVRLDWDRQVGKAILPSFEFVPQQRFIFAYHEPDRHDIPSATGEALDPTKDIILVQGFELRLLTRANPFFGERCPKHRFIVYSFDGDESPFGLGLGYSLYPAYILKREAKKAHLMQSDRGGSPPVMGQTPANLNERDPQIAQTLVKFDRFLKNISPGSWGRFPEGYAVMVQDAIAKVPPEVHLSLINLANAEISEAILGEELFSEKASSSHAANASQTDTIEESLIDGDCSILDEQLQAQYWSAIAAVNGLRETPMVRRATRADLRAGEAEKQQVDIRKAIADRDAVLINQLHLIPSAEYIQETYGAQWTMVSPTTAPTAAISPEINPEENLPAIEDIADQDFSEPSDFARLRMAGNTQQVKNCKKGYSCGYSCISTTLMCRRILTGQAANYASWLQSQILARSPLSETHQAAATAQGLTKKKTAAKKRKPKPKLPEGVQLRQNDYGKNYEFSVGRSQVSFTVIPSKNSQGKVYKKSIAFEVNGSYDRGNVTNQRESNAIALKLMRIMRYEVSRSKNGEIFSTSAWTSDGQGAYRARAYEAMGFSAPRHGEPGLTQLGIVKRGKLVPEDPN